MEYGHAMRSVGFRGLLQVNKPSGMNSTELTNLLKNILRDSGMFPSKKIKVGHSGTLDRFASGLMIVGIGSSCKELHKFLKADKRYVFTAKLGEKTDTLDPSGNLVLQKEWKHISEKDLARTIETFIGKIEQIPPIFSALSMNGTRLHRIARRESGSNLDMIKIPSRTVYIKELILKDFNPPYFTAGNVLFI